MDTIFVNRKMVLDIDSIVSAVEELLILQPIKWFNAWSACEHIFTPLLFEYKTK